MIKLTSIFNGNMWANTIPKSLEPVHYFFEPIDSPIWYWAIRGIVGAGLIAFILIFTYYYRKKRRKGDK